MNQSIITRMVRGFFFFVGFALSKVKYIPLPFVSPWFQAVASICYFIGHSLEYRGGLLEIDQEKDKGKWYGFLSFKEQYSLAAAIGMIASLLGIVAAFYVPLLVAGTWLFLIGNMVKVVGEYHKYFNPPVNDKDYSPIRQRALLDFAITNAVLSVVVAVAITLIFVFPPLTFAILGITGFLGICIGALAFKYWLISYNVPLKLDEGLGSYQSMHNSLANSAEHRKDVALELTAQPDPQSIVTTLETTETLLPTNQSHEVTHDVAQDVYQGASCSP